jgi:hypothetical protein
MTEGERTGLRGFDSFQLNMYAVLLNNIKEAN